MWLRFGLNASNSVILWMHRWIYFTQLFGIRYRIHLFMDYFMDWRISSWARKWFYNVIHIELEFPSFVDLLRFPFCRTILMSALTYWPNIGIFYPSVESVDGLCIRYDCVFPFSMIEPKCIYFCSRFCPMANDDRNTRRKKKKTEKLHSSTITIWWQQ